MKTQNCGLLCSLISHPWNVQLEKCPRGGLACRRGFFFLRAFLKFYLFTNRHLSSSLIIGYNILPYILRGKKRKREKKIERQSPKKDNNRTFSLSRNKKKKTGNLPVEEAKKLKVKCHKRLIYKQFIQVSDFCGPQFLSYLPKRFTHLCRALYRDPILVYIVGFRMTSLKFKLKNYRSYRDFTFTMH